MIWKLRVLCVLQTYLIFMLLGLNCVWIHVITSYYQCVKEAVVARYHIYYVMLSNRAVLMWFVSILSMYFYNAIKYIFKLFYEPRLWSNRKLYHIHFYCFFAYIQEVFSPNSSCFSLVNVVFVTFGLQRPFLCFSNLQISCYWCFSII